MRQRSQWGVMMAGAKSAEAFRTISEAASELDVPQHVLRHWEEVFGQIRPMRRAGGRRYYRPIDLDVLRGVRALLHDQGYTTKGVQKIFKENGVKYVAEIGRLAAAGEPIEIRPVINDPAPEENGHAHHARNVKGANGSGNGHDDDGSGSLNGGRTGSLSGSASGGSANGHQSPATPDQGPGNAPNQHEADQVQPNRGQNAHANGARLSGDGFDKAALRAALGDLLQRLEKVEAALDDTALALDAIAPPDDDEDDRPDHASSDHASSDHANDHADGGTDTGVHARGEDD